MRPDVVLSVRPVATNKETQKTCTINNNLLLRLVDMQMQC